ncbi:MAG: C45 family autoproteolytic acyltransferase/hydrolase [Acidimicrobiales bacterium]
MASAAGISAAEAIVVGGFTDFVDTVRGALGGSHPATVVEDDCTAVIVPDQLADGAGVFGQTWDMHDSATDHVVLLRIRPDGAPAALVFTTTGCVGQIGMNEAGVCVGINNLTAADGRAGVTWPVVVREMLTRSSAGEALEVLRSAELAGAHNYLIFDSDGTGYDVEAMPSTRSELELADWPLVHTNHVLSPEAAAVEGDRPPALVAGSRERLARAERLLKDRATAIGVDDVMALTRDPRSICQTSTEPYRIESSGAAVMRPRTGDFWACWGPPAHNDYEHFTLATVT